MTNMKSKIPHGNKAGVYLIPCKNPQHLYIGETGRHLKVRLAEHQQDAEKIATKKQECFQSIDSITRTRSTSDGREKMLESAKEYLRQRARTALAAHVIDCDAGYAFEDARVIHDEHITSRRKILESLYISKNGSQAINHKRDTQFITPNTHALIGIAIQKDVRSRPP